MVAQLSRNKSKRFSCAVIGKSGIGKTSLVKTIYGYEFDQTKRIWNKKESNKENVCILSAEGGELALDELYDDPEIEIEGFKIKSFNDFKETYDFLLTSKEAKERYTWIFIDSISEIAEYCDNVMKEKYAANNYERWDRYYRAMIDVLRNFKDMEPYNIVCTFLENAEKDNENKRYIEALVQGNKVAPKIRAMFDEIFYMVTKKIKEGPEITGFITYPYYEYPAKDRSGKLDLWEEPNLLKIRKKIKGV